METVIAGWAAGYMMAILTTAALTFLVASAAGGSVIRRWLEADTPAILSAVPISIGTSLLWTMLGLVLAATYELGGFADGAGAAGAPSLSFAIGAAALGWMPVPLLTLLWRRHWWIWCGLAGSFTLLFGWVMPLLAAR
ncbi:MAG: hypothetical protein HYX53_15845 [Chloroflexi bacterium]|nr:hypothetical protein [Chloroflexota bacterium]